MRSNMPSRRVMGMNTNPGMMAPPQNVVPTNVNPMMTAPTHTPNTTQVQNVLQAMPPKPPVKTIKRGSTVAWCPSVVPEHMSLLASGTSGSIDVDWSSKNFLEVLSANFSEKGQEMRRIGAVEVQQSFSAIAWGQMGMGNSLPAGVIAGGLSDGTIDLWNPIAIARKEEKARLGQCRSGSMSVSSLTFHPTKHNVFASGGSDGDVLIWDIKNLAKPSLSKPHKATKAHMMSVTSCAWNNSVEFILASASEQGETQIWDLRYKRSIVNMKSSGQYRAPVSSVQWHPTESVQIAVAYKGPVVEIWDLRKKGYPVVKFDAQYMHRSVETMAWCPHEPRVILTSGDDHRSICWDARDGSYLTELGLGGPLVDVKWHPRRPSVLSTCSTYNTEVSVHSVHDLGRIVPSWLKRPTGATFGFGGKLISFNGTKQDAKDKKTSVSTTVTVGRTVTEAEFVQRAKALVSATRNTQPKKFCEDKVQNAGDSMERETWSLLRALFEQGHERNRRLFNELGFEPPAPKPEAKEDEQPSNPQGDESEAMDVTEGNEELPDQNDFWDSVQPDDEKKEKKEDSVAKTVEPAKEDIVKEKLSTDTREESEVDIKIRASLIVGDFETAATLCAKNGRMADAILIAQRGSPELWKRIVNQHFAQHPLKWARRALLPLVTSNYEKMVAEAELSDWKETLAMLLAYASEEKNFTSLIDSLAKKLEQKGNSHAATLCYMVSGNVDCAVQRWLAEGAESAAALADKSSGGAAAALQAAIEKLHFYSLARGLQGPSSMAIARKYCEYAGLLASQGEAADALFYLRSAIPQPSPQDFETLALFKRLEQAVESDAQAQAQSQQVHHGQQMVQNSHSQGMRGGLGRPTMGNRQGKPFNPPPGGPRHELRGGPRQGFARPQPRGGALRAPLQPNTANPMPNAPPPSVRPGSGTPLPRGPLRPRPVSPSRPSQLRDHIRGAHTRAPNAPNPMAPSRRPAGTMPLPRSGMSSGPQPRGMLRASRGPMPRRAMPTTMQPANANPPPNGLPQPNAGSRIQPPPSVQPRGQPRPGVIRRQTPRSTPTPAGGRMQPGPPGGLGRGGPMLRGRPPATMNSRGGQPFTQPHRAPAPGGRGPSMRPPPPTTVARQQPPPSMNPPMQPRSGPMGGIPPRVPPIATMQPRAAAPMAPMQPRGGPIPGGRPMVGPPKGPMPMGGPSTMHQGGPPPPRGMLRSGFPNNPMNRAGNATPATNVQPAAPVQQFSRRSASPSASSANKHVTRPRYSDIPNVPGKSEAAAASATQLQTASSAAQKAFGGIVDMLTNSGRLGPREMKRLGDVKSRLDDLYSRLKTGSGITDDTATKVNGLAQTLMGQIGPNEIQNAKKQTQQLVRSAGGSNVRWLTGVKQLLTLLSKF